MSRKVLDMAVVHEVYPLKEPFRITGRTELNAEMVTVTLRQGPLSGRGEAAGVYYRDGEDVLSLLALIESVRQEIENGISRKLLRELLPAGGARNAIDCALWDLEAKQKQIPVWQLAGLDEPHPLITTFTCSANDPGKMAATACTYTDAKAIKLKLTGEPIDADRVSAVRAARPDVWLGIDANQGLTPQSLATLMPVLVDARVELIEQPFGIRQDALLDAVESPIALAADESVQGLSDLQRQVGRVNVINIKLDKCGGLTEGLALAHEARRLGLDVMVGNMIGTSLAMGPAFLLGQLCQVVDLDGPIFLRSDRQPSVSYENGMIVCPDSVWGGTKVISI